MELWWLYLTLLLGLLILLFLTGLPVAFAFLVINIGGLFWFVGGEKALALVATSAYTSIAKFTLVPIPLFIIMGEVLFHSGIVRYVIEAVDAWVGRLRARLCLLALGSGTILAAMTGVAMASAAMLGSILLPEMSQRGYDKRISIGTILGSACLAAIIPPSTLAILVGTLGEISIAGILVGGIIPGLLLSAVYIAYIVGLGYFRPQMMPVYSGVELNLRDKLKKTLWLAPFGIIIFAVLGLIILGIATPSEASAVGALSCFLVAALFRRLSFSVVKKSLTGTIDISVMVFMIFIGSTAFAQLLVITGVSRGLTQFVVGLQLPTILMFIVMQLLIFMLCMFIDQISIMMVTLPILMPIVTALNIDPLWFGIIYLVNIVLGGITPPFGLVLFAMQGAIPHVSIEEIYRAVLPFVVLTVLCIVLMIAFPTITLWLPDLVVR